MYRAIANSLSSSVSLIPAYSDIGRDKAECEIISEDFMRGEVDENVAFAQAILKNLERFEFALEKLTELGVKHFNPLIPPTDTFQIAKGYDLTSEYAGMSETELEKEFAMARYIATPEEINRYKQLKGEDAKRKFLADFWGKKRSR